MGYGPGSPERAAQLAEYERMLNQDPVKVPMVIGGKAIFTDDLRPLTPPHDHKRVIGHAHFGKTEHVKSAIDAVSAAILQKSLFSASPIARLKPVPTGSTNMKSAMSNKLCGLSISSKDATPPSLLGEDE